MRPDNIKFYHVAGAKANLSKVLDELVDHDVIITKNGTPKAVLMDYERYTKLMKFYDEVRDLYLLEIGDPSLFPDVDIDMENPEEV